MPPETPPRPVRISARPAKSRQHAVGFSPVRTKPEGRLMPTQPSRDLQTFPNPKPGRPFEIAMECPEFTCVCPMTGQPDFATIRLRYVPAERCVELKSLKLYLWSFRDEGTFHEAVTNRICDDLVAALAPRWIEVVGDFAVRGGIHTVVTARHGERPAGV
ncbi:GTP cyclohydrolase I [Anaeromyxobacter dehalogenans 2CP-C]|nr:GTP cyclohydrolase I [Anaeromyxobacter dehalogenans 2CP-C]